MSHLPGFHGRLMNNIIIVWFNDKYMYLKLQAQKGTCTYIVKGITVSKLLR